VLWDGEIPDLMTQLIGPDVKFHHCKLNMKLPGMGTYVGYHQDHPFDPHTNDDVAVALLMLDDTTLENGCLTVVPGSHRERYSHYRGDTFVGEIAAEHHADFDRRAVPIIGKAGDVCLQSTWMVHGGGPNRTDRPRRILICDYTAADAFWLMPPIVPSPHSGRIAAKTRIARFSAGKRSCRTTRRFLLRRPGTEDRRAIISPLNDRDRMAHTRLRKFNTKISYPEQSLDNDLCMAVRAGNHIFLRGQVGQDLQGNMVGVGDPGKQAQQAMRNVRQLLEEAGSKLAHICKITIYLTDPRSRAGLSGDWRG
jgi:enamine deaminase RidA (YjgF/YER057c/UK114 family)